jgi:putative heme-binding domain-containing protein
LLRERIGDEHPRVRLEAVRSLAKVDDLRAIPLAMQALDQPVDRFLEYALWLTAWESRDRWVPALQSGRLPFRSNSQMAFALKAAGSPAVVPALVKLIRSGDISPKESAELLPLILTLGGPQEAKLVFDIALDPKSTSDRTATLLTALAQATSRQRTKPAGDLTGITPLLKAEDEILRSAAIRCAGLWKIESLRKAVLQIATDAKTSPGVRRAGIEAVASFGGDAAKQTLRQIASTSDVGSRTAAVLALTSLDATLAAEAGTVLLSDEKATTTSEFDAASLYAAFLSRKQGAAILAKRLAKATIPSDVAKIGLRAIEASGRKQPALENALRKAGRITAGPKTLTPAELSKLVAEVKSQGDPSRGEAVFRRKDLSCAKCHAIGGAGGRVGPDLISLGASAQVDYLIESLLEPNKKVKENYNTIVLATDSGKVHSGILLRRTNTEVVLRDAEDREIAIAKKSIEEEVAGASIMPAGLTEKLTRQELVDLVRFLSELGKIGKFAIGRESVVRRWRLMNDTPDARFRLRRTSYQSASGDDPAYLWAPAYSTVDGSLPLSDIPELRIRNRVAAGAKGVGFVRCELDVTTPGKVALVLKDASALKLWLDGRPIETAEQTVLDLSRGVHRLTFSVDLEARKQPLRVAIETMPDSQARVQVVSGK